MVGGVIVEKIIQDDVIYLNVKDRTYPKDRCGILVVRDVDSQQITVGDTVWWQGHTVYWTPTSDDVVDYPLIRASYSGVNHPDGTDVLDHSIIT